VVCTIYHSTLFSTLILQLLITNCQCLFSQGSDLVIEKQLKDAICVYTILRCFCLQLEKINKHASENVSQHLPLKGFVSACTLVCLLLCLFCVMVCRHTVLCVDLVSYVVCIEL